MIQRDEQRATKSAKGAGSVLPTRGDLVDRGNRAAHPIAQSEQGAGGRFRPPGPLGLGGVAIGNGFAPMSDEDAYATLDAAHRAGIRYFDTSPFYGFGLSERRFGHFLRSVPRDSFVLSTKVGRLFSPAAEPPKHPLWKDPLPFSYRYDYSASGTRRAIEDSLERLGLDAIDVVFIHDLSPDNDEIDWRERFEQARTGAMPELSRMRDEGIIGGWGLGVNRAEPALRTLDVADPDVFLLATQYSLLDHGEALERTFPVLYAHDVSVVVGAPLNAGYLGGRDRYDYDGTVPGTMPYRRERIQGLCREHGIDLRTASLQFAAAPEIVSAIVPGARTPEQVRANVSSMQVEIPEAFWHALKIEGLIAESAPIPEASRPTATV